MTYEEVIKIIDVWLVKKEADTLKYSNTLQTFSGSVRDVLILALTGDADRIVKQMQKEIDYSILSHNDIIPLPTENANDNSDNDNINKLR
jgi:hypothetical protein